jgi:hypothetical protein
MPQLQQYSNDTNNKPIPTIIKGCPYNLQLITKRKFPNKKGPHPRCRPFNLPQKPKLIKQQQVRQVFPLPPPPAPFLLSDYNSIQSARL